MDTTWRVGEEAEGVEVGIVGVGGNYRLVEPVVMVIHMLNKRWAVPPVWHAWSPNTTWVLGGSSGLYPQVRHEP